MEELKSFIQEEITNLVFRTVEYDEKLLSAKLLDSISLVDLIVAIEDHLDITVPTADVTEENFDSIDIMCTYLDKLQKDA
jgi:acyl carrier protein